MSRRVRRDSETSTDSWSLVEEDHLDDDFSLNSTDNEEANETEPIIEEPLTTDDEEEEEDTASEKSLDSESEDSEDSESEASDLSEQEEEVEEGEEALEKSEISGEGSEDSEMSDAESVELSDEEEEQEDSEDEDVEEEDSGDLVEDHIYEIGEGEEITARSEVEAALKCKEDMEWMYEELGDLSDSPARKIIRVLFAFSLFMVLFPLAEIFTSWTLNVKLHRNPQVEYSTLVFDSYSPQSYDAEKRSFVYKTKEESEQGLRQWRRQQKASRNTLHLLEKILNPKTEETQQKEPLKSFEILELFKNQTYNWKHQSEPRIEEIKKVDQKVEIVHFNQSLFGSLNFGSNFNNKNFRQKRQNFKKSRAQCRALAPVPPAPFSPRKVHKLQYPRHQPCFVHVNQSKWTCQKSRNLPSVIYHQNESVPNFTVLPRKYSTLQKKQKAWGVTGVRKSSQKYDICGKKASASMRTISKPTDTCHSRQLSKFTPRRVHKVAPAPKKHIEFKPKLPCRVPVPMPTVWFDGQRPDVDLNTWEGRRILSRAEQRNRRHRA